MASRCRNKQKIPGYRPLETVDACCELVYCLRRQDKYKKAGRLLQGLGPGISKEFRPDHYIALQWRKQLEYMSIDDGNNDNERLCRERLQICLASFGIRHFNTLSTMGDFAICLSLQQRYSEAESLLCTFIRMSLEVTTEGKPYESFEAFWAMSTLSECLNMERRYQESEMVLEIASERFRYLINLQEVFCWGFYYQRAIVVRFRGQILESEKLFRELLNQPGGKVIERRNAMKQLAEILVASGRDHEAVAFYKERFLLSVKTFGVGHDFTVESSHNLGFCYAKQGRYEAAIGHFEHMLERLTKENMDFNEASIGRIKLWISGARDRRIGQSCCKNRHLKIHALVIKY